MGILLRSSNNDEGPSRVWMALLEQHSPSSPVFHNLHRFIDAISPTAPTTGLPLKGKPMITADAFRAVSEEIYTGGDSQSPRPISFSCFL